MNQAISEKVDPNITLKIHKLYKSYVILEMRGNSTQTKLHQRVAKAISTYVPTADKATSPILAVEYLDHKNIFGRQADLKEMQKFKSRVRKQTPVYDPDVEREKEQLEREQ